MRKQRIPWAAAALAVGCCRGQTVTSPAQTAPQPVVAATVPAAPRPATQESVSVVADRGLADVTDAASSVDTLQGASLLAPPAFALDDVLHQVAGFQLFRRTSSWTANPTSQGVSLRGLGSTAASRTLVVSDQVPFNDPFGGWVHWSEIPIPATSAVVVLRGGAADLYGSSAIGGVIDVVPVRAAAGPRSFLVSGDAFGASEDTALADMVVTAATPRLGLLAAGSTLVTGGYIPTAPALRGAVDVASNVNSRVGRLELRTATPDASRSAFVRGNVLAESRQNGTPLQTNGTNLWRYGAGGDIAGAASAGLLRVFGARETYRQSFSAIAANRNSEMLTRIQQVPLDEVGLVAQVTHRFGGAVTGALGVDVRDIRATDAETAMGNGVSGVTTSTSAHQRAVGGYADAIWQPGAWSFSGSIRVDSFRTFAGRSIVSSTQAVTLKPELAELFAGPRLGVVRKLPHNVLLSGTVFRAFRGPTLNELYRTSQVGQQTTLANASLLAERATGFEFGLEGSARAGRVRASYFWTEVNRPVSAVSIAQTVSSQTLQRENLGQIRSRGLSLEGQSAAWHGADVGFGYQLAVATVTRFTPPAPVQPDITGRWLPEVPRQAVSGNGNIVIRHIATLHAFATYNGRQYDDSANLFLLHPFARIDVSVERPLTHGLTVFGACQNLLNRQIDAGRTPILTLASPRVVQGGIRFRLSQ